MDRPVTFEGSTVADGLRFAVVVARFNDFVTERLLDGAVATLHAAGVSADAIDVIRVPGAFEIPAAAERVAEARRPAAVICLGCLIRGATAHFEYISSAVAHGITAAAGDTGVPIAFGVLTTNTIEQAMTRAADTPDNKGREAAAAAIEMAALYRGLANGTRTPRQPA